MAEQKDLKRLLRSCTPSLATSILKAVRYAARRHHEQVEFEHILHEILGGEPGDVHSIFHEFDISVEQVKVQLRRTLSGLPRATSTATPGLNPMLTTVLEAAWSHAGKWQQGKIRTGNLLYSYLLNNDETDSYLLRMLRPINLVELQSEFPSLVESSSENREAEIKMVQKPGEGGEPAAAGAEPMSGAAGVADAISKYCRDVTELARNNLIDPVFGRDKEVQQALDILARRKKNNPILVGEPGVGKTAIVNGLAHRIVKNDVPRSFQNSRLVEVDLGLLQAGASVKGEFENRLKSLIDEVRTSTQMTILFIDEAHNLIGAGGSAGSGDAANLLKPALAAGELRSIAATTWSEYKKYIEKDPALDRRFQRILVGEPSIDDSITILRGAKESYEKVFGVRILDEAVVASVDYGNRYIAGRFLPDVAFDLIDTAGGKIKNIMESKPPAVDLLEREIVDLEKAIADLNLEQQEGRLGTEDKIEQKESYRDQLGKKLEILKEKWEQEREVVDELNLVRRELLTQTESLENLDAEPLEGEEFANARQDVIDEIVRLKESVVGVTQKLKDIQRDTPLLKTEVDKAIVATVVSDLTGIPIDRIESQSGEVIAKLPDQLKTRVKGQDHAISEICDSLANYQAGINNPDAPIGVFLLLGPSGTGKTYIAELIAADVFGGGHYLTKINMSEYTESHTVSRLIGSPPGYVGYGEGGVLSEAVRQRPFSVVLLDEVEKAARQVWELFYEVFDKGDMRDGEGKPINFRNTLIFLTSNVGDEMLLSWFEGQDGKIDVEKIPAVTESIREFAEQTFPVALLNRMKVIPFMPLDGESMSKIILLKLNSLKKRVALRKKIEVVWTDAFIAYVLDRCKSVNVGARLIDQIVERDVLPKMSREILRSAAEGIEPTQVVLDVVDGAVTINVETE